MSPGAVVRSTDLVARLYFSLVLIERVRFQRERTVENVTAPTFDATTVSILGKYNERDRTHHICLEKSLAWPISPVLPPVIILLVAGLYAYADIVENKKGEGWYRPRRCCRRLRKT